MTRMSRTISVLCTAGHLADKVGTRVPLVAAVWLFACLLPYGSALGQPWHAAGWRERAVYAVPEADGTKETDVAAVRVLHGGGAAADGRDYRVFDAAGAAVPYEVAYHHPERDALLLVRCQTTGKDVRLCVYWGNAGAAVDPMRAVPGDPDADGLRTRPPIPGAAAGGWIPHAGLVLTTMRREPDAANPETPAEMAAMIARSTAFDGGGIRANISDAYNPWGNTDNFISVYRGWLRIPSPGSYTFCTASNEASFSFLDGKELVHWPGRHTEARGTYGEINATRDVSGLHYIVYIHENAAMQSVAFLGVRPPGAKAFGAIPNDWFPRPHAARLLRTETADSKTSLAAKVELIDSFWPEGRKAQHTRMRFIAEPGSDTPDLSAWKINWTTGDGQAASGATVDHIYLATGNYRVTMTATGPEGQKVERVWPVNVYAIERAGAVSGGSIAAYAPIVARYEPEKLPPAHVVEMARVLAQAGDVPNATKAAAAASKRSDVPAPELAQMHLLLAQLSTSSSIPAPPSLSSPDAPDSPTKVQPDPTALAAAQRMAEHLRQALVKQEDIILRVETTARLAVVTGVDMGDTKTANELFEEAHGQLRRTERSPRAREAVRRAAASLGDARLYAGDSNEAAEWYRRAESLAEPVMPPQVRAAKSGAYPEMIDQALMGGRVEDAATLVERWRDELPTDQLKGVSLFYKGKVEALQGDAGRAATSLRWAVTLGQGAEFEAEARWLLAESLGTIGDAEGRRRALTSLEKSGLDSPYRLRAVKALQEETR